MPAKTKKAQAAEPRELVLEYHDPNVLEFACNARGAVEIDPELLESIRAKNLLQPVLAVRAAGEVDGEPATVIKVVLGKRRLYHAREAGLTRIPVLIAGDERTDPAELLDQIVDQYDENERRRGFTSTEKARSLQMMLDLGATPAAAGKRLGLGKDEVAAARALSAAPRASAAADRYTSLDLEQSALLAEAEEAGDVEALAKLEEAAAQGGGQVRQIARQMAGTRDERKQKAGLVAELTAAGVKVIDGYPGSEQYLDNLNVSKADKTQCTAEGHKGCPGHAAYVRYSHLAGTAYEVVYLCTDPDGNGHAKRRSTAGKKTEKELEELRHAKAGNAEWRPARAERRTWLTGWLGGGRKRLPDDARRFKLVIWAQAPWVLTRELDNADTWMLLGQLLGLEGENHAAMERQFTALMESEPLPRAEVLSFAQLLAVLESDASMGDHIWRHTESDSYGQYGESPVPPRYLGMLAGLGYEPSAIEQRVIDAPARAAALRAERDAAREAARGAEDDDDITGDDLEEVDGDVAADVELYEAGQRPDGDVEADVADETDPGPGADAEADADAAADAAAVPAGVA